MAEDRSWAAADVALKVSTRWRYQPRERRLNHSEIIAMWQCCAQLGWPFEPIFKLALLTGQRMGEIVTIEWAHLDDALWVQPPERNKSGRGHAVPLSAQARAIIEQLPKYDERLVFTLNSRKPVGDWVAPQGRLAALMTAAIGPRERWTSHDLRRTCATGMGELGVKPHVIEMILNHAFARSSEDTRSGRRFTLSDTASTYQWQQYLGEKADALSQWGEFVEELVQRDAANAANAV